ncbi:WAP four-disulfide core domain protein 13 [Octodon degus]|uniref:WAP four-disulfide core domain protein 13 n=1 Tax=Octodon degus TaxID=10160 RepID=A0A6P6EVZ8_OCTDE|nr:WAP four-disulfide core domain protein 13 [Octodon degus]
MNTVLFLQFLLVLSLMLQLVPGSPRQRFLKYILEPPTCISDNKGCYIYCTPEGWCPPGFQCCTAYCGIICSKNKPKRKKDKDEEFRQQNI